MKQYDQLLQELFWTKERMCTLCEFLEECSTCPFTAAYSTPVIGQIPTWFCHLRQQEKQQRRLFWQEINRLS